MENQTFHCFRQSDRETLNALTQIRDAVQGRTGGSANIYVAAGAQTISGSISDIASQAPVPDILNVQAAVVYRWQIALEQNVEVNLYRDANVTYDRCVITYPGNDPLFIAKLLGAAKRHLHPFDSTDTFLQLIGTDNAAYLARRDENLRQLEDLVQSQINRIGELGRQLEARDAERREASDRKSEADRAKLQEEFDAKLAGLAERERGLQEERQKLNDNTSKYTRREIYRQLQERLEQGSRDFSLSRSTSSKRWLIHGLFVVLIAIPGFVFTRTLVELFAPASSMWTGSPSDWAHLLRLPISGAALAAAVIFYIRWNDLWFRQHAREEFWLNRLGLDVSRASFLVEMALEWKDEKESPMLPELLDALGRGLFTSDASLSDDESTRHPAQDLASKLLGASSQLSVNIPGVGDAKLDRKAIDRFRKTSKDT